MQQMDNCKNLSTNVHLIGIEWTSNVKHEKKLLEMNENGPAYHTSCYYESRWDGVIVTIETLMSVFLCQRSLDKALALVDDET